MAIAKQPGNRLARLTAGDNFRLNLADEVGKVASMQPQAPAVLFASKNRLGGGYKYDALTFEQCRERYEAYAAGLHDYGIRAGDSVVLLTKPSLNLVPIVLALWRLGAVLVSVDPGASRKQKLKSISEVKPKGFIGLPAAHLLRLMFRKTFDSVTHPVTVGRRLFWSGPTLRDLRDGGSSALKPRSTMAQDELAVIFTSGSTGSPKGVVYTHGNGGAVVQIMKEALDLGPADVTLACHPIFSFYSVGLGATVIVPDIDPRFPAEANPEELLQVIRDQKPTVAFMQLSIVENLLRYCVDRDEKIPHLRKIITTGAPLSLDLIRGLHKVFAEPEADVYTMYGATEALSVCYAEGREILRRAANRTRNGKGIYLGRPAPSIKVRVIDIVEEPIQTWREDLAFPTGEIGEICVAGPVVTAGYKNRPQATRHAKIKDATGIWHRMGDAGYFDEDGGLWYCGRIADRVRAKGGYLYPGLVEPIFNEHPQVHRSALVGVSQDSSPYEHPVVVVEPDVEDVSLSGPNGTELYEDLQTLSCNHANTRKVREVLLHDEDFSTDVRHNAKIRRDLLTEYASQKVKKKKTGHMSASNTIRFRGHNIHYYESGSGDPMLFLHNAGNDHRIWEFQLDHFAAHYRVVAPDSLGYGRSDSPKIDYTLPVYTDMVATIVKEVTHAPVTIVGNCTGAAMALGYALQRPEQVERLILFNVATEKTILEGNIELNYRVLSGRPRLARLLGPFVETLMSSKLVTQILLRSQYGENPPQGDEFAKHVHQIYNRPGKMSAFLSLLCHWASLRSLDHAELPEDFPPVHVIWGESNKVLPAARGREFCRQIEPDTADFIDGAGHLVMRERPELINARMTELLEA